MGGKILSWWQDGAGGKLTRPFNLGVSGVALMTVLSGEMRTVPWRGHQVHACELTLLGVIPEEEDVQQGDDVARDPLEQLLSMGEQLQAIDQSSCKPSFLSTAPDIRT